MNTVTERKGIAVVGTKAKGGIHAVIENHIQAGVYDDYDLYLIASHDDGGMFKRFYTYFAALASLLSLLFRGKVSVCHLHGSHKGSIYRKALFIFVCRLFKCKVIFHLHGSVFARTYDSAGGFYRGLVKYVLNGADSVFVLSQYWANYVGSIAPDADIRIINNFPSPVFEGLFHERRFNANAVTKLLFLGYIGQRKGVYDLVDAVAILKAQGVTGFTITVGGNGEIEQLKTLIKERELCAYFDVIGWVTGEQKYRLMNESDVLLLPSHNEGLPIAILEAMSAGLAVISTTVGGIPEAIPNDQTGLLIEPGDQQALASAIAKYIANAGLVEQAARCARQRYDASYSSAANLQTIRAVLRGLVNLKLSAVL
ncbi:glycosyltransferase family 4 protein [Alteromonas sp. AMM-1]|uniref:glycosyltransferase family 4 protein n=1 Tax=Alteromonas sp. AMM-1 TaxID=3394233 RepID=UPI0039A723DE